MAVDNVQDADEPLLRRMALRLAVVRNSYRRLLVTIEDGPELLGLSPIVPQRQLMLIRPQAMMRHIGPLFVLGNYGVPN